MQEGHVRQIINLTQTTSGYLLLSSSIFPKKLWLFGERKLLSG